LLFLVCGLEIYSAAVAGRHVWVERPARRRRRRERYDELAAGTCVRSVAAMAYGLCQDAESAPTPAGTMTVISWPVFGARTRRCEPGPAPVQFMGFALFLREPPVMRVIRPTTTRCILVFSAQQLSSTDPPLTMKIKLRPPSGCKDTSEAAGARFFTAYTATN
jgi:hypothetical protein